MSENTEIKYKAKNGQILIARDEVQAAAFEKAGLEKVDSKPSDKKENE